MRQNIINQMLSAAGEKECRDAVGARATFWIELNWIWIEFFWIELNVVGNSEKEVYAKANKILDVKM